MPVQTPDENLQLLLAQMQSPKDKQALIQKQAQSVDTSAQPADSIYQSLLTGLASQAMPSKSTERRSVVERANILSPQDYAILQMRANEDPNLQKLKENQAKLEELAGVAPPPAQTNLAPFLGLVDAWTGSKLANAYAAPPTSAEQAKLVAGLQDMIQKSQLGITEAEAKFIKDQLAGKTGSIVETTEGKKGGSGGATSFDKEFRDKVNKTNEDITTAKYNFTVIEDALKTRDFSKLNNVKAIFARAVSGEKGVLTDKDVDNRVLPQSIQLGLDKAASYFNEGNTKYDPEIAKNMQEMLDIAKEASIEKAKDKLRGIADTYSSFEGFGESHAKTLMNTEKKVQEYSKGIEEKRKKKEAAQQAIMKLMGQ